MQLICYPLMQQKTRLCMTRIVRRRYSKWGREYQYVPRQDLVQRLATQLGWTEQAVRNQIKQERDWLIKELY
ncbi:hypothetical protein NIES4074_36220 [Cylindrospermum sp. NIES-4074]|nr:hypothetical protein NIES4074_36220 [Cylindrospermum sp. NIES-4074]